MGKQPILLFLPGERLHPTQTINLEPTTTLFLRVTPEQLLAERDKCVSGVSLYGVHFYAVIQCPNPHA
jgi:hypothetical protein